MGLINILKKISQGSYGLVARNITYIYLRISKDFSNKIESGEQLFTLVGLINAHKYIEYGQIAERDILMAIILASEGKCGVENYSVLHDYKIAQGDDSDILVNFIMSMEVLYFSVDSKMDIRTIVNSTIKMKPVIEEAMQEVLRDFKYNTARNSKLDELINVFLNKY